jgi:hypothetical protein
MPALSAVVFVSLITIRCFQMPAPKAENGFVTGRIVSSPKPDETFSRKSGDFNRGQPIERRRSGFPIGPTGGPKSVTARRIQSVIGPVAVVQWPIE